MKNLNCGVIHGIRRFLCIRTRERILHLLCMPERARCVEIGVDNGFHSEDMIRLTRPAEITLVDPAPAGAHRGCKMWDGCAGVVRLAPMKSDDFFAQDRSPQYDYIYIDGDHSHDQVMRDVVNSAEHVRVGGFIIGDDYSHENVRQGLVEAMRILGPRVRKRFIWHTQFMIEVIS